MRQRIAAGALDQVFISARTYYQWASEPVPDHLLAEIYELAKLGPTSANCSPLRVAFVRSADAKERLYPALSRSNLDKARTAPVVAILASDRDYIDRVPYLFPASYDARSWFNQSSESIEENAVQNAFLQIGYFILAARSLGLDCGPMSGFNRKVVDGAFFPDDRWRTRLLVNLGLGTENKPYERRPRLPVSEACVFL